MYGCPLAAGLPIMRINSDPVSDRYGSRVLLRLRDGILCRYFIRPIALAEQRASTTVPSLRSNPRYFLYLTSVHPGLDSLRQPTTFALHVLCAASCYTIAQQGVCQLIIPLALRNLALLFAIIVLPAIQRRGPVYLP